MSYAIIRNSNYKKDNLSGLYKHNERKNTNYSNEDIDKNRSNLNYSIKYCSTTYSNKLKQLIKQYNLKGRIISTTNVMCEFIITSDKEFFERIGEKETQRYFQTAYNFVAGYQNLGSDFIISAKVHMDEVTPHMHLVFVPVIHKVNIESGKDERKIACSEYWKGKDSYKRLQDSFYNYITKSGFDLERGRTRDIEHLSTKQLKEITEYESIKQELKKDNFNISQNFENENKGVIIEEHKKLIKYCKELKQKLYKSTKAITKCEILENENTILKKQVSNLERENNRLENYIENVLEVVKVFFNYPIKSFKKLVNTFIKSSNEIDYINNNIIDENTEEKEKVKVKVKAR
jgi:hypothetical protein